MSSKSQRTWRSASKSKLKGRRKSSKRKKSRPSRKRKKLGRMGKLKWG